MCARMYPRFTVAIAFLVAFTIPVVGGSHTHVECSTSSGPVHMDFAFPSTDLERTVVLLDPRGNEVLSRRRSVTRMSPAYRDRVHSLTFARQSIQFQLQDDERSLAGRFSCRYDAATGPPVPDCGETLQYLELTQPRILGRNTAVEGGEVQLTCLSDTVASNSDLGLAFLYTWFKDATMVSRQRGEVLTLREVTARDEGDYSCRVAETSRMCSPSAQSSALRLVLLKPPKVHIEPEPAENVLERRERDNLTLTCVVESAMPAVPREGFTWTFSPSHSSPARQLPLTGDTLILGPVTREDSGQYTCQARNDQKLTDQVLAGNSSVRLLVSYLERLSLTSHVKMREGDRSTLTSHEEVREGDRSTLTSYVEVREGDRSTLTSHLEVREGDRFTLTCSVDSSPPALLQWQVDGEVKRGVRANVDRFVVMATTARDSANYTCSASNGEFPRLAASILVTCVDCRTEERKVKSPASTNPGVAVHPRIPKRLQRTRPLTPDIIALIAASVGVLVVVVIVVAVLLRSLRCQVSTRNPEPRPLEQRISLLLVDASGV